MGNQTAGKTMVELKKTIELRSQQGIEIHVKEVRKRRNLTKKGDNENKLSDFDTQTNEILEDLENVKYNDLEDLV